MARLNCHINLFDVESGIRLKVKTLTWYIWYILDVTEFTFSTLQL